MNRKRILFAIAMIMLSTLACGRFYVQNNGPYPVAVKVILPDGSYGIRTVWENSSASWYAADNGEYRVDIIRDEDYVEWVRNRQARVMDAIFGGNATGVTDESELKKLVEMLSNTQTILNDLASASFSSCSGIIPGTTISLTDTDYEEVDITVTLNYDEATKAWSCSE